jgi:hypothetical protein
MKPGALIRLTRWLVVLALLAATGWMAYFHARAHPEDLPWTPLELDREIGLFTGPKIGALTRDRELCLTLLERTGLRFAAVPAHGSDACLVPDAVRLAPGQEMLRLNPGSDAPSCPVMAGLAVWQWQVVGPAAQRLFGANVSSLEHYGSHACRRLYGRSAGGWSEHATADAIDIAAFVLSDGTRISVLDDWEEEGPKAEFLREVRDGACRLFSTVLSPDYNAQHANHLHLDQAERMGWRACR